jgi:hypothetical protein
MSNSAPRSHGRIPAEAGFREQTGRTLLDKGSGLTPTRADIILQAKPGSTHRGVPQLVALPAGSHGGGTDLLEPAPPPFPLFLELRRSIQEIYELRISVEGRMEDLKKTYNASAPRSRLRLRPWSRRKGEPPYAVYWVFLTKKKKIFEDQTLKAIDSLRPRWFRRLKIRTRRDLDLAIHRAGLDTVRPALHEFHDNLLALNEAHRVLARGMDSVRKMLASRAAGKGLVAPPLPAETEQSWLSDEVRRVADHAWRLECLIRRTTNDLEVLSRLQGRQPGWVRYRLEFRQGKDHPYGRLVWRDRKTRATYARLDDRTKRKLGIPAHLRGVLTPFELDRRQLMRDLKDRTSLVRRLRTKVREVMELAQEHLGRLKLDTLIGVFPEDFSENWRYR